MKASSPRKVAVVGSGPAALMAATQLIQNGVEVDLFERRNAFGRKLLIAGSSGLNISFGESIDSAVSRFQGFSPEIWRRWFSEFSREDWLAFIHQLKFETFLGTSDRYFVREMKASRLLKAWLELLRHRGVTLISNREWKSMHDLQGYAAVGFFLGGGSWEESTPLWPEIFERELNVRVHEFYPTNVGYDVDWRPEFLREAEGKPLKNIVLTSVKGSKAGELMVTQYGLEGTPIYFLGQTGLVYLDLKPNLSDDEIRAKLLSIKENLAPIRRIKKGLNLNEGALALLFHHTSLEEKSNLDTMIKRIKAFPIELLRPRPLLEAISSGGGVDLSEIETDETSLMLKKHPGIFCGGEMLDWQAPTGGYLIQACVTQGAIAARSILRYLESVK